jgi:FkbM family methyltransferase
MSTPDPRETASGRNSALGNTLYSDLYTASSLKLRVASVLASDTAGRVIGALSRNRIRHRGLWFDVRSSDFSPRVRAQMFWGMYESAETRMIKSLLQGSTTVIELGSSLGVTTKHIASHMAPHGRLVCVEANPHLLPGLHERISPWTSTLHVDVIHAAITSGCGTTAIALSPETFGSHLATCGTSTDTVQVPSLTLREVVRRSDIEEFDLVSDIEGAEATFLLEDPSILQSCSRAVIELHESSVGDKSMSVSDLMVAAVSAGFRIVTSHGPVVALSRF